LTSVSIITPVFNLLKANRQETFRQTVRSVADQSYSSVDHIIVDGESSDGTRDFVISCLDGKSRARVITKKDRGIYEALNNGADAAMGDYLMFINSDDYLADPGTVARLAAIMEADHPDLIYGPVTLMNEAGATRRSAEPDLNVALRRMPFSAQGIAVKRRVFDELSGFDEDYPIMADYDLILRLLMRYDKVRAVDEPISVFREGGASGDYEIRRAELIAIWKKNLSEFTQGRAVDFAKMERRRTVPMGLLRRMARSHELTPLMRRIARHEMRRSIRRVFVP
jgi:glycosyltransferase involved in cell wall biosynthesis